MPRERKRLWQMPSEAAKIYRLEDLVNIYSISRNAIYHAMVEEGFPQPLKLSSRSKGWWKHEVEEWFANRPTGIAPCGAGAEAA